MGTKGGDSLSPANNMDGKFTLITISITLAVICSLGTASSDVDGLVQETVTPAPAEPASVEAVAADNLVETEFVEDITHPQWHTERAKVWETDSMLLQSQDKAMYKALSEEMKTEKSAHWDKYLRHKGLKIPSAEGHKWQENGKEMEGVLMAKEGDSRRLCDQSVKQHYGYFHISGGKKKHYFYWMFEATHKPRDAPVVMWLTGGPGCSSEVALFTENGPCSVNKDGKTTTPNKHSWNRVANVIYVDQP